MSESEVAFRIVDRAGNLHRLKAVRLVTEHERVVVFYNAACSEVASFVEPVAVTLDSAESLSHLPFVQGEACATVIQSTDGIPPPILWITVASLAALVAMRACELFGFVG
jgi:hypothetical protein